MEVILAGMNIDKSQLDEITDLLRVLAKHLNEKPENSDMSDVLSNRISELLGRNNLTPETLSAAYARISRDPRPIDQLRDDARRQVGKARRSNRNIIFGLGHASVAEHAVFNLDILGVSRYLSEILQSHRLCSFTEKSQRYIHLDQDYHIPEQINASPLKNEFNAFVKDRFSDYKKLVEILEKDIKHDPSLSAEDARYILPLCTTTQMGMTVNARNLEMILQQAASSDVDEYKLFGEKLFSVIDGVAPSIIKYTEASTREKDTAKSLKTFDQHVKFHRRENVTDDVQLLYSTPHGDQLVANAILSKTYGSSLSSDHNELFLEPNQIQRFYREIFRFMNPWDAAPREFEYVDFIFEICISAAAYAQLKRHRMMTITASPYNPVSGIKVPPVMSGHHCEDILHQASEHSQKLSDTLSSLSVNLIPYIMLGCHRRRVIVKINARELIHLSRLREDEHAQWDIRDLATAMVSQARKKVPGCMILACGKDRFETCRESPGL
jgi:flavin-dependent thymidylate synthase